MAEHAGRMPIAVPRDCFGLSYAPADPLCQACAYNSRCAEFIGQRSGQVPLDRVSVNLAAPIRQNVVASASPTDVNSVYQLAHRRVFAVASRDFVSRDTAAAVTSNAADLAMSIEPYVYAVLLGHKISCPERRFAQHFLGGESAVKRARFYRKEAARRYAVVDVTAIGALSDNTASLDCEMQRSEQLFGEWIVNTRLRNGGNGVTALYAMREMALSPYWLATEPTFSQAPANPSKLIASRRCEVARLEPHAAELCLVRSRSLLAVAGKVSAARSVPLRLLRGHAVTDAFRFWLALGDALQRTAALQLLWPNLSSPTNIKTC